MFCIKCGAKLEETAKFCCFCGAKLNDAPSVAAPPVEIPVVEQEPIAPTVEPMVEEPIFEPIAPTVEPIAEEPVFEPIVPTVEPIVEEPIFESVAPTVEPIAEEPIFEPVMQQVDEPIAPQAAPIFEATQPPVMYAPPAPMQQKFYDLPQPTDEVPKKKKSKLIPILIGVLVALIGAAAALYFTGALDSLLGKDKTKKEDISGYYVLQSASIDGETLAEEELVWGDYALFLLLDDDGTALFFNGEALIDCTYENGELELSDGTSMAYRVKKDKLTLTTAEGELVFQKSDDDAPDCAELEQALATPLEIGYYKFEYMLDGEVTNKAFLFDSEYENFLILYEDGTGVVCLRDQITDLCWDDGEIFPADQKDDPATYTVDKDGFTMNKDGYQYVFKRSDETPPDIDALREELEAEVPGYYILSEMKNGDQTVDVEAIFEMAGRDPIFILIYEDGTAVLNFGSGLQDMLWDEEHIYPLEAMDEKAEYQIKGDELILDAEGLTMIFKRSDETPPDIDAMREENKKPTPVDVDLTGEYELYAYDMGSGLTETSGATLTLNSDGTGTYSYGSGQMDATWSAESLKVGTITYTYQVEEDGTIVMTGADGTFYFKRIGGQESRWSNDWYGFWMVTDCTGDMKKYDEMWWDLCARSTDNGDGTCEFIFWDEDYNSVTDPIGEVVFKILEGDELQGSEGWYYYDESTQSLQTFYDYAVSEDMIVLEGTYSDSERSYTYTIYLRPWGTRWDDLDEDWQPYYYDEWYLPLIEANKSLPDMFELP